MNACDVCGSEMLDAYGGRLPNCSECRSVPSSPIEEMAASVVADETLDGARWTGKSIEFLCPVCPEQNLEVATIAKTQTCCCRNCCGFLVDSHSLAGLIGKLRAEYQGVDDQPQLMDTMALQENMNCPTCLEVMYTHPYNGPGNAIINSCSACHLNWLDEGEFSSIIRAPGKR